MKKKSQYKVAVIGLGYVGLPFYISCVKKKIDVKGFDINELKIKDLKNNISNISDVKSSDLKKIKKNFFTMKEISFISDRNFIIFCLPTPLTKNNSPDISYLNDAVNKIKTFINNNSICVIESTVYPGATREIFSNNLKTSIKDEKIINFGFSSERISPGQKNKKLFKIQLEDIPKVVSGNNNHSLSNIKNFYSLIFKSVVVARSIEVAEMSKLLENSYRSVNIGLVNELKMLCYKTNINIYDVISAASTKPFGFNKFMPGPGVGGHCIPIDPIFLSWFAKKNNSKVDFITLARKKNLDVTQFIVKNILSLLNKLYPKKKNIKILKIGVAYKKDINDYRESPSLEIMRKLNRYKVKYNYYDPYINKILLNKKTLESIKNLNKLETYNATVLVTDHSKLPYNKILSKSKIIIDTRGKYKNYRNNKKLIFL